MRLAKPEKRAPRPRKRLARGKRPRKQRKTSRAKLGRLADKLFSRIVRHEARCAYHSNVPCSGPMQCCHIVSRRYRSVRWSEANALPMCAGAHRFFTGRELEWRRFIDSYFPEGFYDKVAALALKPWDKDLEGVLVRLAARAVALGIPVEGK